MASISPDPETLISYYDTDSEEILRGDYSDIPEDDDQGTRQTYYLEMPNYGGRFIEITSEEEIEESMKAMQRECDEEESRYWAEAVV